uniref:Reverse transcriptase n=1 Tax=Peronospora matthiolae TaxID=2874970 RepID=A0AAV1TMV4_9STRA
MISAFTTPSGLYEWLRMPFDLKNAPQMYRRMVNNALYGYLTIGEQRRSSGREVSQPVDVFTHGDTDPHRKPSMSGRRSYIDDIMIPASFRTSLC